MSASQEKKRRLEDKTAGANKKSAAANAQTAKAAKEKLRNRIIFGVIIVVSAAILFFSSNMFSRMASVIKIGGTGYSAPEYKYFYSDTYNNYYNQYYQYYGEYAQYMMPDAETLKNQTINNIQQTEALYDEAKANNFEPEIDIAKSVDDGVETMKTYASQNNFPSLGGYLAAVYGKGMNEKLYRQMYEKSLIASLYYQEKINSFEYTDEELKTYYGEHKNDLDKITYYYRFFDGAAVADNPDTEEDETKSAEQSMADAKKAAEEYAAGNMLKKFEDDDGQSSTTAGGSITAEYKDWLLDGERKNGDYTLLETSNGYYVVCFVSRDNNDYATRSVRHILVQPETINRNDYETEEAYNEAVSKADADAKAEAEEIYNQWKNGEATEESFKKLADEKSDDKAEGGLCENVYKGQMVTEFNDWVFANHKAGDTDIVKTTYGYHIIYFCSADGENYQLITARNEKRTADYNAWLSEKKENGYNYSETIFKGMAGL